MFRTFLKTCCFAGILALFLVALQGSSLYENLKSVYFRITIQSSVSDQAVLYYDTGRGFGEQETIRHDIPGDGQFHVLSFELPRKTIYRLRFDPLRKPARVAVREVSVVTATGMKIRQIEFSRLLPLHEIGISSVSQEAG